MYPNAVTFGRFNLRTIIMTFFFICTVGCGRYAGGQGYNSIGHFCGGWAGNCGDGGIGGSTWYLVCDRCREKYLREKQTAAREKVAGVSASFDSRGFLFCFLPMLKAVFMLLQVKQSRKKPLQVKTPRALPTMEAHQVIRANALFLLSLSSAAEPSMLCHHPPRPLHSQLLPSLKEGVSDELPNKMGCLYLQTLARYLQSLTHEVLGQGKKLVTHALSTSLIFLRQHTENFGGYQDDNLFQDEMRYLRSTSVPAPYISVTPDACPNVFEEPESNMKSMPPRSSDSTLSLLSVQNCNPSAVHIQLHLSFRLSSYFQACSGPCCQGQRQGDFQTKGNISILAYTQTLTHLLTSQVSNWLQINVFWTLGGSWT